MTRLDIVAAAVVGRRVEISPHFDAWMAGYRFGTVVRVTNRGLTVQTEYLGSPGPRLTNLTEEDIASWID